MNPPVRRLYRLKQDSRIAGVCTGIGSYFDLDPVVVRLAWVLATVFSGGLPGILAYLLAWLVVPEEPASQAGAAAPAGPVQVPPTGP